MISAIVLSTIILPQTNDSLESRLKVLLALVQTVSIAHGCDESMFEYWDLVERGLGDGTTRLTLHTYSTAGISWHDGSLSFRHGSPPWKVLTATEQADLWSQEACTALARDLLVALRPGVIHELGATEYDDVRGNAKFTFLAKHGSFRYREFFQGATTVEMDATSGRVWRIYILATPPVRSENLQQGESEAVLRQRAVDAYSGFAPYPSARIGLAEYCVMSPKRLLLKPGLVTDRHRQIAAREEGMLMYRVIFQRMQNGEPKADYRYMYVDATTGMPLATYEFALEVGRRGSAEDAESPDRLAASGPVRVLGSTSKFVALNSESAEKLLGDSAEPLLLEFENGLIVKAEYFEADGIIAIPKTARYRAEDELVGQIAQARARRSQLPSLTKNDGEKITIKGKGTEKSTGDKKGVITA